MNKIIKIFMIVIGLPLIGIMFIRPNKAAQGAAESKKADLNYGFDVVVRDERGDFSYSPEETVELMMAAQIPKEIAFSEGEDFVENAQRAAYDSEQEYLKALSVVLRTNLIYAWERGGCEKIFDFEDTGLRVKRLKADASKEEAVRKNEIEKAAYATRGVVITKEGKVIAAPFFTSAPESMLINEAGNGEGFSLNYAYYLAETGMDFYRILKYFYAQISVEAICR